MKSFSDNIVDTSKFDEVNAKQQVTIDWLVKRANILTVLIVTVGILELGTAIALYLK